MKNTNEINVNKILIEYHQRAGELYESIKKDFCINGKLEQQKIRNNLSTQLAESIIDFFEICEIITGDKPHHND